MSNLDRTENTLITVKTGDGIELYYDKDTDDIFVTISSYARMGNISKTAVSGRIKEIKLQTAKISTTTGVKTVSCINIDTALGWLITDNPNLLNKLVEQLYKLTGKYPQIPSSIIKSKSIYKSPEKKVQKRLAQKLEGVIEVQCKSGSVDILTGTEIIEVKKARHWKHAIGQVLVYQLEYPTRQARIHLYEKCSDEFKQMIISFSSQLNIVATFEN